MEKSNKKPGFITTLKKIMLYFDNRYDRLQKEEIIMGWNKGLDTYFYNRPEFDWKQMREIRLGLEKGLDVSMYAKEEFNIEQMEEIRMGQEKNLDVSFYNKPEFGWKQMREIKLGLDKDLDVSKFSKSDLDIDKMEEVRLGLEKGLDVSFYNKENFDQKQMREIRLGLERGLDVSSYSKENFSVNKMEKVRTKLEKENPITNNKIANKSNTTLKTNNENRKDIESVNITNKDIASNKTPQNSKTRKDNEVVTSNEDRESNKGSKSDKNKKDKNRDIEKENKGEDFSFSRYDANVVFPNLKKAPTTEQLQKLFKQRYKKEEEVEKQTNIFNGRVRKLVDRGYIQEQDGKYNITDKGTEAAKNVNKNFEFTSYDANVIFGHIEAANGVLSLGNLYSRLEEEFNNPEDVEKQFNYLKNRLENNLKSGYVVKDDRGAYSISEIGQMKAEQISEMGIDEESSIEIEESTEIEEMEF